VSFYKKKDATYVFYYIRTPPCQFSLSDEFVLPRKWWRGRGVPHPIWDFQRGEGGVPHPIWDFHIWWFLLHRKHILLFLYE